MKEKLNTTWEVIFITHDVKFRILGEPEFIITNDDDGPPQA